MGHADNWTLVSACLVLAWLSTTQHQVRKKTILPVSLHDLYALVFRARKSMMITTERRRRMLKLRQQWKQIWGWELILFFSTETSFLAILVYFWAVHVLIFTWVVLLAILMLSAPPKSGRVPYLRTQSRTVFFPSIFCRILYQLCQKERGGN